MASSATRDINDLGGTDPYVVLGVRHAATDKEIRRAFRQHAARAHPDRGGNDATFRALTRARDVLLDARRRSDYDAALRARTPDTTAGTATNAPVGAPADLPADPPVDTPVGVPDNATSASGTGGWGVATVVLAFLGPLLWPVAIVVGHIGIRRTRRKGRDSGAAIPIVLALLYILTYFVGFRVLGVVIAAL